MCYCSRVLLHLTFLDAVHTLLVPARIFFSHSSSLARSFAQRVVICRERIRRKELNFVSTDRCFWVLSSSFSLLSLFFLLEISYHISIKTTLSSSSCLPSFSLPSLSMRDTLVRLLPFAMLSSSSSSFGGGRAQLRHCDDQDLVCRHRHGGRTTRTTRMASRSVYLEGNDIRFMKDEARILG
jgi:hypothetical protein